MILGLDKNFQKCKSIVMHREASMILVNVIVIYVTAVLTLRNTIHRASIPDVVLIFTFAP
jgi:hypothetical protein